MKNLAPMHFRQRLIIEGTCYSPITAEQITNYLTALSDTLEMHTLIDPIAHQSPKYGWAGWIHWETSGCHFYAWDEPFPFFSVDIYTCKAFSVDHAVAFTKEFFNAEDIEWKEV